MSPITASIDTLKKRGDKTAIIWESDDPSLSSKISYMNCIKKSVVSQTD